MAYLAIRKDGDVVEADHTGRDEGPFKCRMCGGEMRFVAGEKRTTKHFRHTVESNCDWEPESSKHVSGKRAIRDAIRELGIGSAEVEQPIGSVVADTLWTFQRRHIAFEVQAAAYEWSRFSEKLRIYREHNVAVVYLFIGENFGGNLNEVGWRIREIEKQIFTGEPVEKSLRGTILRNRGGADSVVYQMRAPLGKVVGGYLRRKNPGNDTLRVNEPLWSPLHKYRSGFLKDHFGDAGKRSTPLDHYLLRLYRLFLERPECVWLDGAAYRSAVDAKWGYVFRRLGLKLEYHLLEGEFHSYETKPFKAKVGQWPQKWNGSHSLRLNPQPIFKENLCFIGDLFHLVNEDHSESDEGILGGWKDSNDRCVYDFGQYNQIYAGVLHGFGRGGPGGHFSWAVAADVSDLWDEVEAVLSSGYAFPTLRGVGSSIRL